MRRDLNELFRDGLAGASTWTHAKAGQALQALAAHRPGSRMDWEPGDEEWGRIVDADGGVVGLVCARIPIGAARDDIPRSQLPDFVTWILFKSMDEPVYHVTPEILEEVFGRQVSRNVDDGSLSLNDLWWATVS
jgi:hypothetical protein